MLAVPPPSTKWLSFEGSRKESSMPGSASKTTSASLAGGARFRRARRVGRVEPPDVNRHPHFGAESKAWLAESVGYRNSRESRRRGRQIIGIDRVARQGPQLR